MIQLIVGNEGKGKTSLMLDKVNREIKEANGNIVYLDKNSKHMYELNNKIRLVDVSEYGFSSSEEFYGFICGIISQDHDLEQLYFDNFKKICCVDNSALESVLDKFKALSEKKLVAFAKKYAREREYVIGEMGELALHTQISMRQSNDHAVTVMEVKRIVDDAIKHVEKKTATHFFDILLGKRYDIEDMTILGEKDFA